MLVGIFWTDSFSKMSNQNFSTKDGPTFFRKYQTNIQHILGNVGPTFFDGMLD
jgi:hypothetical protein